MNMKNIEAEPTKEEEFVPGDRVELLIDGRKGIIVVENSPSLLPEGIVEVKFDGETEPEGVQVSDLRKVEEDEDEDEDEIEKKDEGEEE